MAVLASMVPTAQAATVVGPSFYQRWLNQATVPTPRMTLRIYRAPCPQDPRARGCIIKPNRIYIDPAVERKWSPQGRRIALMHEVGHMFDFHVMTDRWRQRFEAILHLQGKSWDGPRSGFGPYASGPPMEKFAENYAECAVVGPTISHRLRKPRHYRYRPTPRQYAQVCRMIRRIGRIRGLGY